MMSGMKYQLAGSTLTSFVIHAFVVIYSTLSSHPLTAQTSVSDFLDAIDRAEANSNAYSPELSELYVSLGQSLIDEGNYDDARQALQRGVQIERVNYGLDSLSQTPHLLMIANLDDAIGNKKDAQRAMENVYQISSKNYGDKDPRILPVLNQMLTWQTDRYVDNPSRESFDHVVAAELAALRIAKVMDANIPMNDPRAPDFYQKLASVQYLIANHIDRHGLPHETGFEFTTGKSAMTPSPTSATHTYYRRGKAALLNRVDSLMQQAEANPLLEAEAIAELADWYLIFGQRQAAASAYQVAFQTLQNEAIADQVRNDFFAEPKAIDFPFEDSNVESEDNPLQVSVWITETGRTRNIEIIDPPNGLSEDDSKYVRSGLRKTRFRPRLSEGVAEAMLHTVSFQLPPKNESDQG